VSLGVVRLPNRIILTGEIAPNRGVSVAQSPDLG
jgi:hypothetical protein